MTPKITPVLHQFLFRIHPERDLDSNDDEKFIPFRYEGSSLDGDTTHREQDFGYEVIDQPATVADVSMMDEEGDDDDVREAEMIHIQQRAVESGDRFQYRGTPERERKVPSRNKRRQQAHQRYSQEVAEQVSKSSSSQLPRRSVKCPNVDRCR